MDNNKKLYRNRKEPGPVEISTLGRFLVRRGEKVFSENSVRAAKVWSLFKYLLTYRSKAILPERGRFLKGSIGSFARE
jgi:hypothetical protein